MVGDIFLGPPNIETASPALYLLVYLSAMSTEVFLSDNDESSSLDSNISLPDLTKLQPYEFEPLTSSSDSSSSHSDYITYCLVDDSSRKQLGNTKWCQCGNCRPMERKLRLKVYVARKKSK